MSVKNGIQRIREPKGRTERPVITSIVRTDKNFPDCEVPPQEWRELCEAALASFKQPNPEMSVCPIEFEASFRTKVSK